MGNKRFCASLFRLNREISAILFEESREKRCALAAHRRGVKSCDFKKYFDVLEWPEHFVNGIIVEMINLEEE